MSQPPQVPPGYEPQVWVLPAARRVSGWRRVGLPALLLACTLVTTLVAGFYWHAGFVADTGAQMSWLISGLWSHPAWLLHGLPFALALLLILLSHEMGHYVACRFHGLYSTLPYVIPVPPYIPWLGIPLNPFGTFGAVIKIRSLFLNRRQFFDVGIAGPLAGFLPLLPILFVGVWASRDFTFVEPSGLTLEFGEPLLFKIAVALVYRGASAEAISLHPIGWAAWFGMLATSLNLLPIGQLDGGHIVYSLLGPRGHRITSYVTLGILLFLGVWQWLGYVFFGSLAFLMGFRHPPAADNVSRPGRKRLALAVVTLVVLILTFIPVPVRIGGF